MLVTKRISGLSGEVWGRWGWVFPISWAMVAISLTWLLTQLWAQPAPSPSLNLLSMPLFISALLGLSAGAVLMALSLSAATRRYRTLKSGPRT